jgi:tetratricopeptide (TPR) repeat protein
MNNALSAKMKTQTTLSTWLLSLLFIGTLLLSTNVSAQKGNQDEEEKPRKPLISQDEYNKLLMWIVDEKFENVLYKCIRYTENDKTKKLPLPYLYMGKAYLGIHLTEDNELRVKFQVDKLKALKNSLKYTAKFRKKDKENLHSHEHTVFFDELWNETKNAAETEMDSEKYTKARSYYKYLATIDPEDPGAWLMYAAVYQHLKSRKEAADTYEKARQLLLEFEGRGLREVQMELLLFAIIYNVELLKDTNRASALEWLAIGEDLFPEDRELRAVKGSIGG